LGSSSTIPETWAPFRPRRPVWRKSFKGEITTEKEVKQMSFVEFSKVERDGAFSVIPAGIYIVVVERIEERRTKGGDPLWRVCLRIRGGRGPGGRQKGRCVFDSWAFSPKALPRIKLIAEAFGLDARTDRELSTREFVGKEVEIEVGTRRS